MHPKLAEQILINCREREAAHADVTQTNAPHGPETYEDAIIELGRQRDEIAAATRKVFPMITRTIASEADVRKLEALLGLPQQHLG